MRRAAALLSLSPFSLKKTYMPPSAGLGISICEQASSAAWAALMPFLARSRISAISPSPWAIATAAPAWSGPDVPLFMYWVMADRRWETDGGCVSQPTRQPVMAQLLEKLFTPITRSSGSARRDRQGATPLSSLK